MHCKDRDDGSPSHHQKDHDKWWDSVGRHNRGRCPMPTLDALRFCGYAKAQSATPAPARARPRSAARALLAASACLAAALLLIVPLLTLEADARGGGGGGGGGRGGGGHAGGFGGHGGGGGHGFAARGGGGARSFGVSHGGGAHIRAAHVGAARIGAAHVGRAHIAGSRLAGRSATPHAGVAAARVTGHRLATASARTVAGARAHDPAPRVFGNRAIANAAWGSRFASSRFHGRFSGSAWPWWWGGLVAGWVGPLFWTYDYYDAFEYGFWPYAYDDFWPYAYDDVYYGIYGPYAYYGPYGVPGRRRDGARSGRYAANGPGRRAAEVCSNQAPELTDWPIERISEVVQPTDAQRLDELRAASAKAIEILQSGCPKDLPSIPTGRLSAIENRLQVMLAAVQTMRPALERFYRSLSDEQKARFNAIASADDPDAAAKDQRDLTRWCDQKTPGLTDLPIDRIAQAIQPTPEQRAALDELEDASVKAGERLKTGCPTYQMLTPTGRVEAMEKRLEATLAAVKTVQPVLAKFYNSLSDEQKARFNSLRSASRPTG